MFRKIIISLNLLFWFILGMALSYAPIPWAVAGIACAVGIFLVATFQEEAWIRKESGK